MIDGQLEQAAQLPWTARRTADPHGLGHQGLHGHVIAEQDARMVRIGTTDLVDAKHLDSFDIISIVGEFNEAFDVEIDVEDLEPYNFNTVAAMQELIKKLQDE